MVSHLFPTRFLTIAGRKATATDYDPEGEYDPSALAAFKTFQNKQALKVLLICLAVNAVFGFLYLAGFINAADMLMLTMVYFLCDYIFILFFCPCQTLFLKNKCCINCRIYDWGHFLMFLPMVFVGGIFGLTLFFMSLLVLFRWEILWALHPERFFEGSNKNLQCVNCKEKTCRMKTAIAKNWRH